MPFGSQATVEENWQQVPPSQPTIRNYTLLPRKTDQNYMVEIEELYKLFQEYDQREHLVKGKLHPIVDENQRVTIIYQEGGVFTFDLREQRTQNS